MKQAAAPKQAGKTNFSRRTESSAEPRGIALAPPNYRIDFVDQVSASEGAIQLDGSPRVLQQKPLFDGSSYSPRAMQQTVDRIASSSRVLQQKAFFDSVRNSPRAIAQRQRMESLFGAPVQRREMEELPGEPGTVQRVMAEATVSRRASSPGSPVPFGVSGPRPNNTGLPDGLKSGVESLSSVSLGNVRVHYNSSRPAQLDALAYAQGSDIHVAPGQERHLPHEAWHVVQQAQGRVKPTLQMKGGVPVNDDAGLEREADVMGAKALQMRHHPDEGLRSPAARKPALQRMTARVRRDQRRDPTAEEIAATRVSAIANSQRLAGHGRSRHGRQAETPADVQEQQAAADRQDAINQAIQLKAEQSVGPAGPAHAPSHTALPDGLEPRAEPLSRRSLHNVSGHSLPGRELPLQRQTVVIQRHHNYGGKLSDPDQDEVIIYKVVKDDGDVVVYVGQTCANQGIQKRFEQHLKSGYHPGWSSETHTIKKIESGTWTILEAKIAEQYWIDKFLDDDAKLENARQELTYATWLKYRDDDVTTPNFKGNYHPRK